MSNFFSNKSTCRSIQSTVLSNLFYDFLTSGYFCLNFQINEKVFL